MNWIASLYMGSKGAKALKAAQAFLSGKKTYIVAASAFLTALTNLLQQFIALPDATSTIDWLRHLTGNTDALVAWHSVLVMTMRAGISKSAPIAPVTVAKEGP